jgi:hypothetical protein
MGATAWHSILHTTIVKDGITIFSAVIMSSFSGLSS